MPTTFISVIQGSFTDLWISMLDFLPRFLGAAIVFLIGIIVAGILQSIIEKVVSLLKIDELAAKLEVKNIFEKAGVKLHIGHLLGWIVKWFFIVVFLIASTEILGWAQVSNFLQEVVMYLPNVLIAVIILLVGVLLANFVKDVVKTAVEAGGLVSASFLSGISRWAILVFAFMAALVQLGIAQELIRVLFTGLVAMLALAGGLAFGLGGKDHAAKFLSRLRKDIVSEE